MLSSYQILKSDHFEIYHSEEDDLAQNASNNLENALVFCKQYFSLKDQFPKIRVVFVNNRDEFDRLVRDLLMVEIETPSHPARIAQTQRFDMVVLSPTAYEQHSTFTFEPEAFNRLLFHELVHIVEEYLSPNIEKIPNWWSEGLAIYLSDQWRFDDIFRKPALVGIKQNFIPSLSEIESDRRLSYDWGWTIVFYIESLYGQPMIKKIITECGDGEILKIISNDIWDLELEWKKWLFHKFLV
jgi:hypothetical protein